jgi:hypothetical protein
MGRGRGTILGKMVQRFVEGSAVPVMVRVTMENAFSADALDALFEVDPVSGVHFGSPLDLKEGRNNRLDVVEKEFCASAPTGATGGVGR